LIDWTSGLAEMKLPMRTSIAAVLVLLCCSVELAFAQATAYQSLLDSVQSPDIGSAGFPSLQWRKATAGALLNYCESALSHVPRNPPSADQSMETEENSNVSAMPFEFARWRLAAIFGDCIQLTREIQNAEKLRREIQAWIKLNRLLEDDPTVKNLIVAAKMLPPGRDRSDQHDILGIANWRPLRVCIFEAVLKLLDKP
jgi:hypothetical protein